MLYDAHNHLHDARLNSLNRGAVVAELAKFGLQRMVVNGTEPEDWTAVETLARALPEVVMPSYGVHPWRVAEAGNDWFPRLQRMLDRARGPVGIGEVGLDRWIEDPAVELQETIFRAQLRLAAERNLPLTIHCLRAWGPLVQILREEELPARGFLIHSVGASPETIRELSFLGAYFSVSGPFGDPAKLKYQEALRAIPPDRLLIETDAPDMLPPPELRLASVVDAETGKELCHPFNLLCTYVFVREFLGLEDAELLLQVHENFHRFFLADEAS
jgi:TatD DNase family protein